MHVSIPYRSYSNMLRNNPSSEEYLVSIPYRSYSNSSLNFALRAFSSFQSLIGLILTSGAGCGYGKIRLFQSLIGLILTSSGPNH